MSVTVRHLNADSTFLLIFSPEAHPVPSDLKSANGAFSVLIDPWLVGSSIVTAPWFAITKRNVPSSIQHLSEIEEPDVVVVSQNKPDHCHKETLLQLRPEGKTIIAAEPGAAKAIKGWNHFDPNRVYGLAKYDPKTKFKNCLRVAIPPLSGQGHAGEVSIAFIPAKNYMTGLHNAFGITYLPPTHVRSLAPVSTIDLPKSTKYFHMPMSPVTEPPSSPPQPISPQFVRPMSFDVVRDEPRSFMRHRPNLSRSSKTASSEFLPHLEQSFKRNSTDMPPQRPPRSPELRPMTSPSNLPSNPPLTMSGSPQLNLSFDFERQPLFSFDQNPPPAVPDLQESEQESFRQSATEQIAPQLEDPPLRRRKSSKFIEELESPDGIPFHFNIEHEPMPEPRRLTDYSDSYPQPFRFAAALPTPPESPAMTLSSVQRSPIAPSDPFQHSPANTSYSFQSLSAVTAISPSSTPATTASSFSQRRSMGPSHQQSLSTLQANPPLSPITPGRPRALSIIYAPHGLPPSDLKPYIETHLVRLPGALPLSLLLHGFDHAQNPWYLGGNIMAGAQGGAHIARTLMARCWISAHDEPKDDQGFSVKQLKVRRGSAEAVRRSLWEGEDGEWLRKTGWTCDVRSLDVGKEMVIGQSRDLLAGMEYKRESRLMKFGMG